MPNHADKTQEATNALRYRILSGGYRPGELLSESRIAEDLNHPIMPIRSAIARLAMENLITVMPRRGTFVHAPARLEIVELLRSRLGIELMVVRELGRLGKSDLHEARQYHLQMEKIAKQRIYEPKDVQCFADLDGEFHCALARAAGFETTFAKFLRELWMRARLIALPDHQHHALQTTKEHADILDAIMTRSQKRSSAAQAVRNHLQASIARWQARPGFEDILRGLSAKDLRGIR